MEKLIQVADGPVMLEGSLSIPEGASSIVLFAHGSGSSRHSSRNIFVAQQLNDNGLGTLLIDLLSENEDADSEARFDIRHLARRLIKTTEWLCQNKLTANLQVGYFGASTGAAAALVAAAALPDSIAAVVSRGGRPDLAGADLPLVKANTLLIVGGNDRGVIELNEKAYRELSCYKNLVIVPGATHLFAEPGTLEEVAILAIDWFKLHLDKH